MKKEPDHKAILLSLLGSLTLCDHMGDVGNDAEEALKKCGLKCGWDPDEGEPQRTLHKMGVKTLYGTELTGDEDEDEA